MIETAIGKLVVKRYNTKNIWHWLRRNFQTSRAMNCSKMATLFNRAGIIVAEPVGVIEHRFGPLTARSWYVSKFVENEQLRDFLKRDQDEAIVRLMVEKIVEIFKKLKNNKLSHGDMKASNILVNNHELILVDLDASAIHSSKMGLDRALSKDGRRFIKNWQDFPTLKLIFSEPLSRLGFV